MVLVLKIIPHNAKRYKMLKQCRSTTHLHTLSTRLRHFIREQRYNFADLDRQRPPFFRQNFYFTNRNIANNLNQNSMRCIYFLSKIEALRNLGVKIWCIVVFWFQIWRKVKVLIQGLSLNLLCTFLLKNHFSCQRRRQLFDGQNGLNWHRKPKFLSNHWLTCLTQTEKFAEVFPTLKHFETETQPNTLSRSTSF